jgi:predicted secreted protein
MAAIVGIDAQIDMSTDGPTYATWAALPERNEFSISISVDTAEYKPFVASLSAAWITKARTWMSWSASISGYFDDADDSIFDQVVAGTTVKLRFFTKRDSTDCWEGLAVLTSVDHSVGTDDYATLDVDVEGQGALERTTQTPQ